MRKRGDLQILPGLEDEVADEDDPLLLSKVDDDLDPAWASDMADLADEPIAFEPAADEVGADPPRHDRPGATSSGRIARLVGATMALTAGIILAASLVQRQPEPSAVGLHARLAPVIPVGSTLQSTPPPKPIPARLTRPRTVAADVRPAPLAAQAPSYRPGAHAVRAPDAAPMCWTAETESGLNPGSRVREVRLVKCQAPA